MTSPIVAWAIVDSIPMVCPEKSLKLLAEIYSGGTDNAAGAKTQEETEL
jgi:hypothetical protein